MNKVTAGESLAIIVPAHNEEEGIADVLRALIEIRGREAWELIVVDDGSTDRTPEILREFAPGIRVIRHVHCRGYGASLKTGILATRTTNVLFLDADGQHDVGDLPAFLTALNTVEVVLGARQSSDGIPKLRKPGKWILKHVCNFLANQRIPDINCGYRGGRRHVFMRMLELLPDGFSFSTTSLMYVLKSRYSYKFVPVRCHARVGNSSVRILHDGVKTLLLALRLAMLFDPMRAFGYPALILILIGAVYQTYIIVAIGWHIVGGSILTILAGVILFHFGLLGDQIASLRKEISSHNSLMWEEDKEQGAPTESSRGSGPSRAPGS